MSESQELFEPSQINEDELIDQLLNEEDETQNDEETPLNETQTETEKPVLQRNTGFPLSRIKTLMKMDPDVGLLSSESVFIVAKATVSFPGQIKKYG